MGKTLEKMKLALRSRKHRVRWHRIVSILACISVFVTTNALILPAVSLDVVEDAKCGIVNYVHTDECRIMKDETIESEPAADGAVAVITGMLPAGAKAEIEAVKLSYADMVRYFGEMRASSMSAYVAYDITIMVGDEEWQPNDTVSVTVRQPDITVADGEALAVAHVDSETDDISDVEAVAVDEGGEVFFEAEGFSLYIFYTFTVDFHYGNRIFSIEGYDDILLSELFAALGLDFDAAEVVGVYFTDESLLAVEPVDGDWLLTSLAPFSTYEVLTLVFEDESTFHIWVTDENGGDGGGEGPNYIDYVVTSGAITGKADYDADAGITVKWYSDAATSDLETLFTGYTSTPQQNFNDDGKVLTDKSVTYKRDDYGVFNDYEDYEFGVTLSALGQEYYLSKEYQVSAPVDVMIVLDVSGSMSTGGTERLQNSIKAVNSAITTLMESNPDNRVGVAIFSRGSALLMELGRYRAQKTVTTKHPYGTDFLVGSAKSDGVPTKVNLVDNLKKLDYGTITYRQYDADNNTVKLLNTQKKEIEPTATSVSTITESNQNAAWLIQAASTFTQAGIAEAWGQFRKAEELSFDIQINPKDEEPDSEDALFVEVTRQPVYLLLSDGEPTISTTNVDDPLFFSVPKNNKKNWTGSDWQDYGNGSTSEAEGLTGIHSFYAVQTAMSLKAKTTEKYQTQTHFYTIGLGIPSAEEAAEDDVLSALERAVLDPSKENIDWLFNFDDKSFTGTDKQKATKLKNFNRGAGLFRELIGGTYDGGGDPVNVGKRADVYTSESTNKHTTQESITPTTIGDVRYNYGYADKTFFKEYNDSELTAIFKELIEDSQQVKSYGLILRKRSSITLYDPIGTGMELKSYPVLRLDGVEYQPTEMSLNGVKSTTITVPSPEKGDVSEYHYNYEHISTDGSLFKAMLSDITVQVTVDANGYQTVFFDVPDNAMPVYEPAEEEFYYESLPARLIYQVGLTAESIGKVELLKDGGDTLTFYTNRFNEDGTNTAYSVCYPEICNPYYYDVTYTSDWRPPRLADAEFPYTVEKQFVADDESRTKTKAGHVTGTRGDTWKYEENDLTPEEIDSLNVKKEDQEKAFKVVNTLGNNGKLTFEGKMKVTVKKIWSNGNTDPVTVQLYRQTGTYTWERVGDPVAITYQSGKQEYVFDKLQRGSRYAVAELNVPNGYMVSYSPDTVVVQIGSDTINAAAVAGDQDAVIEITNTTGPELPSTGGSGIRPFVIVGLALGVCSLTGGYILNKKKE